MRAYFVLLIVDVICWVTIWALIRDTPNAIWVMGLIIVYGWANWFRSRAKMDEYE